MQPLLPGTTERPTPTTLGELRASGHVYRPVKTEIRENLVAAMRSGETRFAGIIGFDETVLPALERALLAGHDVVLLALHALVSGQYPQDELTVIGFSSYARTLSATELASLEADYVHGTNLQHAMMLAGRFLDEHPRC